MSPFSKPKIRHQLTKYKSMFMSLKEQTPDLRDWIKNNKSYTKFWDKTAVVYKATRQTLNIPKSFSLSKLVKGKWGKSAAILGGSIIAFNFAKGMLSTKIDPAIPDNYERGYDNIREQLSDFGSPLNLLKTASKVIVPYESTARKALVTDVNAIMRKNLSLQASKNAIRHHYY